MLNSVHFFFYWCRILKHALNTLFLLTHIFFILNVNDEGKKTTESIDMVWMGYIGCKLCSVEYRVARSMIQLRTSMWKIGREKKPCSFDICYICFTFISASFHLFAIFHTWANIIFSLGRIYIWKNAGFVTSWIAISSSFLSISLRPN